MLNTSASTTPLLSWATGYPFFSDGSLHFAINEPGTFTVSLTAGNTVVHHDAQTFAGSDDKKKISQLDSTKQYILSILNLSAQVSDITAKPAIPITPTTLTVLITPTPPTPPATPTFSVSPPESRNIQSPEGPATTGLADKDDEGRPFTTTAAPKLPKVAMSALVNQAAADYVFTDQNARWVADMRRFSTVLPINLGGKRIYGFGYPRYLDNRQNLQGPLGNVITDRSIQVPNQAEKDSSFFWSTATWTNAAGTAKEETNLPWEVRLEAAQYAGLDGWGPIGGVTAEFKAYVTAGHPYPTRTAASFAIGHHAYGEWSRQHDANSRIPEWNFVDVESPEVHPGSDWTTVHDQFIAYFQLGMRAAWTTANPVARPAWQPKFSGYGLPQFNVNASNESDATSLVDTSTGTSTKVPRYYTRQLAVYTDRVLLEGLEGGSVGPDHYWRCTVPREYDFFERNSDGTIKVVGGMPLFNNQEYTYTCYGLPVTIKAHQAMHCIYELYYALGKLIACLYHGNNGQYPERTMSKSADMANKEYHFWDRATTEGGDTYITPVPYTNGLKNYNPVAGWQAEMMTLLRLAIARHQIIWGANKAVHAPGRNYTSQAGPDEDKGADGTYEWYWKAWHRISLVPEFFNNEGEWCFFSHPAINTLVVDGDRVTDKPLTVGKLYYESGIRCFGLVVAFPGHRDSTVVDFTDFALDFLSGSAASTSQTIRVQGRNTAIIRISLPANYENVRAKDVRLRYKDLLGVQRTLVGDLRYANL